MRQAWKYGVVVGASSGIGEAIARELARSGCRLALVARRAEMLERICQEINAENGEESAIAFVHDVRDTDAAEPLLQQIAVTLGGLDLVVYSAGVMPRVDPDSYSTPRDVTIIETNLTGAVAWLNAAAYRFGRAGSGTIIGLSSIAGERGRRGNPMYNATKAALNSYLESLRIRLRARGVTVLTAKPGYVRTPMIGDAKMPLPVITPEVAARDILAAAAAGKRVTFVPAWWRLFALAVRSIPAPLFERLPIP